MNLTGLRKIDELEKFLRSEVDLRDKLTKRFKRRAITATFSDASVLAAITALGGTSIVTLTTGVGMPVSVVLASTGLLLGLGSGILHKTQKIFESKAKKHAKIKTLAESKLDTISGIVSKAVEDSQISHQEYQLILKEVERYRTMKEEIRTKSKKTTDAITAEQREAILISGPRTRSNKLFLEKNRRFFRYPTCHCHVNSRTAACLRIFVRITSSQMRLIFFSGGIALAIVILEVIL